MRCGAGPWAMKTALIDEPWTPRRLAAATCKRFVDFPWSFQVNGKLAAGHITVAVRRPMRARVRAAALADGPRAEVHRCLRGGAKSIIVPGKARQHRGVIAPWAVVNSSRLEFVQDRNAPRARAALPRAAPAMCAASGRGVGRGRGRLGAGAGADGPCRFPAGGQRSSGPGVLAASLFVASRILIIPISPSARASFEPLSFKNSGATNLQVLARELHPRPSTWTKEPGRGSETLSVVGAEYSDRVTSSRNTVTFRPFQGPPTRELLTPAGPFSLSKDYSFPGEHTAGKGARGPISCGKQMARRFWYPLAMRRLTSLK